MARLVQCGLSISQSQYQRIQALAEQQGKPQAFIVRSLIDIALPFAENGHRLDFARLLTILEYSSLALDTLVARLAPEDSDRLLDLAVEHLNKFHAA